MAALASDSSKLGKSTTVTAGSTGSTPAPGSPSATANGSGDAGRPAARSKSGNDLAGSADAGVVDSPASSSPPAAAAAQQAPVRNYASAAGKSLPSTRRHSGEAQAQAQQANGPTGTGNAPVATAGTRGEDSLSATLERLRLNAQAAKNGAQNGGIGAIGSRDGRGPAAASRLAKSSLPSNSLPAPGSSASAAAQAAALARAASNAGPAAGGNGPNDAGNSQMSTFLFDDELDAELHSSTYGGRYLQMNADDDKFPVLIRRDSYPGIVSLSAASAALDLAPLSQTPPRSNAFQAGSRTSEWPQFAEQPATASTATAGQKAATGNNTPTGPAGAAGSRLSADLSGVNGARGPRDTTSSPRSRQLPAPRSATGGPAGTVSTASAASGSTAPTTAGSAASATTAPASGSSSPSLDLSSTSPSKASALPGPNGIPAPQVQVPASPEEIKRKQQLQRERERLDRASAANNAGSNPAGPAGPAGAGPAFPPHLDPGHKFSDGTPSPAAMYAGELAALNGTFSPYPLERGFGGGYGGAEGYGPFAGKGPYRGGQQQQKRDEPNRFAGLRLEDLQGDMAALCKDQHGCRFLQKKLEEGNPEHRDMIFAEIYPHFAELMTDSFGNYLSQKLLEHSSDEQRDALLESISGELVSISLNMHGTRAVQKMIDFLSTQRQVQSLIMALNLNVVTLIKDLNGNHVIQKCLNTLPPEDNQFIYNAVAANCIEVATHRHGCCVLQRCIDHASESQRIQLVTEITYNSLTLVLDPFGNYVVQYVLDLNDSRFISAIVNQFRNNVCALSAQKFSSNVVEKCIRVADLEGRKALISELIDRSRLERMLRDSFANYVVQTALDYAEPGQRAELVAIIRPVLPMIRNTPYGKRIQSKIQREGFHDHYGRGGNWHPHMYGGMGGMGPGYYGMHPGGPYGHPGHHGQGMGHGPYGAPHHGPHYGGHPEAHMGRGAGPYGHQYPQHMPPHMASPAMAQPFSPNFAPSAGPPMEGYPQAPNYPYV